LQSDDLLHDETLEIGPRVRLDGRNRLRARQLEGIRVPAFERTQLEDRLAGDSAKGFDGPLDPRIVE
jgi:hypothetical protein